MEEKKFERPELLVILFEGDLATDGEIIVVSGGTNGGGPEDEWWI